MAAPDAFEHLRTATRALAGLREALTRAAPGERDLIERQIGEARHHIECACAAAGVHPSARPDVEVVRPSQVGA